MFRKKACLVLYILLGSFLSGSFYGLKMFFGALLRGKSMSHKTAQLQNDQANHKKDKNSPNKSSQTNKQKQH